MKDQTGHIYRANFQTKLGPSSVLISSSSKYSRQAEVSDSPSRLVGEVSQNAIQQNGGEQRLSSGKPGPIFIKIGLKIDLDGGDFPE
jgi:hypothetical protein